MRVAGWIGLALALACGAVFARDLSEVREVRKQLEASMLIKGTITVDPEGKVRGFDLVEQDKLPVEVVELIRGTTLQWRFEPVVIEGKPVVTKTGMNVRVVAQPWSDDQLRIRIAGATFGEVAPTPDETLRPSNLSPPDYPEAAWRANAGGTVYVVLKIARTGKVEEAVVEQVNLGVVGTDKEIASLRDMFAKNALAQPAAGRSSHRRQGLTPITNSGRRACPWSIPRTIPGETRSSLSTANGKPTCPDHVIRFRGQ